MKEKDALYAKADFTEEDGLKAADLEAQFAEMDGWNAEADASQLLQSVGIAESMESRLTSTIGSDNAITVTWCKF